MHVFTTEVESNHGPQLAESATHCGYGINNTCRRPCAYQGELLCVIFSSKLCISPSDPSHSAQTRRERNDEEQQMAFVSTIVTDLLQWRCISG